MLRLIDEALGSSIPVAICSTSDEAAVRSIAQTLLKDRADKILIFAGDVVENKKPSPDIYLLAARTLEVPPESCVVVEDSSIGLAAARAANMTCLITESAYTRGEDFHGAALVVSDLDDGPNGPISLPDIQELLWKRKQAV